MTRLAVTAVVGIIAMWGLYHIGWSAGYDRALSEREAARQAARERADEISDDVDRLPDGDLLDGLLRRAD